MPASTLTRTEAWLAISKIRNSSETPKELVQLLPSPQTNAEFLPPHAINGPRPTDARSGKILKPSDSVSNLDAPGFARVFVNWCQQEEDNILSYHMNHLKSYDLDNPEDSKSFRDAIHSIFDWGSGYGRVPRIE
ncbi:MAG: hypothetical protein L6R37_006732 [Teloschistes peruensis]|nr:MAG: hypothetical protein L6R37_006732 [Teloschistes peruensis]